MMPRRASSLPQQHAGQGWCTLTPTSIPGLSVVMCVMCGCSLEDALGEETMMLVKKMRLLQRKGGEMEQKKVLASPRVSMHSSLKRTSIECSFHEPFHEQSCRLVA